ncbi:MAG: DUF2974 domain-containing protein [Oscillospiraceae bacterium]|nr:DUF2974 domain-containing protein [Oscillospiraceae bacterium]
MPNIFDYLHWRCDVPFSAAPFNDVDNLILSELVYTDFGGVVSDDGSAVSLAEARDRFYGLHDRAEIELRTAYSYTARSPFLMDPMLAGARFRDLRLCAYETVTDKDDSAQFAAVTFLLPDGAAYLAYRGTDGTVVGWKEDMILSYHSGTSGQLRAADYLARVAALTDLPLRVGGHSKGGNFAVYAAAMASHPVQDRIEGIWTNDGPGFREEVRSREGYQRIQPKCVSIVPDTSVIGLLLDCDCLCKVVKSTAAGLVQHDGFTWECGPREFLPSEQTRRGAYLEKAVDNWVARQDDATLRSLVDSLFTVFEATGEETFHSMAAKKIRTAELMMAAFRSLPKEKQREILAATGKIVVSTGATAKQMLTDDKEQGTGDK